MMNTDTLSPDHFLGARNAVRSLRSSQIREVANAGLGKPDVLPFCCLLYTSDAADE